MPILIILAVLIFAMLGLLHLLYTVRDIVSKPRYFSPRDRSLLEAMKATRPGIAPHGRDYWSALLGFNISHAIGILLFSLLIVIATVYKIEWLKPVLVFVGLTFAFLAWRFWFSRPLIGALVGTTLMVCGWWLF